MKKYFDKVVEWDRTLAKKLQEKFNLTDYQMLVLSFTKGFIIGAILLWLCLKPLLETLRMYL